MKIYIIGPTGSGKSTLASKLSKKYNIKNYELDCIVFDDKDNHRKRTDEEIKELFDKILKHKDWIIEDVGRSKFKLGREEADIIYYINIPKIVVYKRLIFRWIKQRLGREEYNYPPTFEQLIDMIKVCNSYFKKEKKRKSELNQFPDKIKYLSLKEIKELIK